MAAKRAGQIVISLTAGTAQFVADMETAKAKVRDFGTSGSSSFREFGRSGVSEMRATAAAVKAVEGNFFNNTRAADAFLEKVAGVGPLLQKAFPVIGAVAFAGVILEMGKKVYEFFEALRRAPEKTAGAFAELNAGLRKSNDELDLSNARLENEIAKLEGHRENTLKIALLEAKKAADDLGESLDRDLSALSRLLEENKSSLAQQLFGRISDRGLRELVGGETGYGGFRKDIRETTEAGRANIEAAAGRNDQAGVDAAMRELKTNLEKRYKDLLEFLDQRIAVRKTETVYQYDVTKSQAANSAAREKAANAKPFLEELEYVRANVAAESRSVPERVEGFNLNQKKTKLEVAAANAQLDRPFEDRMKAMAAQIEGVRAKLAAIGQGESAEIIAKAFGDAQKAIEEVNRALERNHTKLTQNQEDQIRNRAFAIADVEAEASWKVKLDSTGDSIENRIRAQQLLTGAIGKGYEATKRASVETSVIGAVGRNYGDTDWMKAHQSDVSGLRQKFGQEYDAQHGEQAVAATRSLTEQINLERSLAAAQTQGAEALRLVTLAYRLREIQLNGVRTATGELSAATREQMAAEIALYNERRRNADKAQLASIDERVRATKRITAAIPEGAEAERKAALENKYEQMGRAGSGTQVIQREREADETENQARILAAAVRTGAAYHNQLDFIDQQIAALNQVKVTEENRVAIATSLRNLENERLRVLLDQFVALRNLRDENLRLMADISIQMGGAKAGVRAFFLEMQMHAKTTAAMIEETLNSALDSVSDNLAKVLTGQRTAWARMFQGLGEELLKNSIKSTLQVSLGKLGGTFGVGKPDGSSTNPFHVVFPGSALPGAVATAEGTAGGQGPAVGRQAGSEGTSWWRRLLGARNPITFGNGGLLGTGQVPSLGGVAAAGGNRSNPVSVTLAPGGGGPDGTAGNPFYVRAQDLFKSPDIKFDGQSKPEQSNSPSELSVILGSIIGGAVSAGSAKKGGGGQSPEARASGGPVTKGQNYIVGERGPEWFTADRSGFIVDHGTTKTLARAGMLPEGITVPGVGKNQIPQRGSDRKSLSLSGLAAASRRQSGVGHATGGESEANARQPWRLDAHSPDAGGNPAHRGAPGERMEAPWIKSPARPGVMSRAKVLNFLGENRPAGTLTQSRGPGAAKPRDPANELPGQSSETRVGNRAGSRPARGSQVDNVPAWKNLPVRAASSTWLSLPVTAAPQKITPRASGGDVSADRAYMVGENGPELLFGASGRIASNAESRRLTSNSGPVYHIGNIDARGTDPHLTEQRVKTAIIAARGSAIEGSVQVMFERAKRTPQRIG